MSDRTELWQKLVESIMKLYCAASWWLQRTIVHRKLACLFSSLWWQLWKNNQWYSIMVVNLLREHISLASSLILAFTLFQLSHIAFEALLDRRKSFMLMIVISFRLTVEDFNGQFHETPGITGFRDIEIISSVSFWSYLNTTSRFLSVMSKCAPSTRMEGWNTTYLFRFRRRLIPSPELQTRASNFLVRVMREPFKYGLPLCQ